MKEYKEYFSPLTKVPKLDVLKDDKILLEINETGKKISVKHFLNTSLFPSGEDEKGNMRFVLYYRVIFNKQSIKIRSVSNNSYSIEEFESLSKDDLHLLFREALAVTFIVNKVYVSVERMTNRLINPGEGFDLSNFDINFIFDSFSFKDYELPKVVNNFLINEIIEFALENNLKDDFIEILKIKNNFNASHTLQFLKGKNSVWTIFEEKFDKELWFFEMYYEEFKNNSLSYKLVGATEVDFVMLNFRNDFSFFFSDKFSDLLQNIERLMIKNRFKKYYTLFK
jgi:hypothetical protein